MKQGKIWGSTECLLQTPFIEVHRILINPNSNCSLHIHQYKNNMFYVISGTLLIETHKNDYNLIDTTILNEGDYTVTKPNEYHMFKTSNKTVEALEIYYLNPIDPNDIIRQTVGAKNVV